MNYIDENAMKETLANENDRKTASPTESAVRGSWRREHSGADDLKRRSVCRHLIRIIRGRALSVREDKAFWVLSMRVVPRVYFRLSVPEYSLYSGIFVTYNSICQCVY